VTTSTNKNLRGPRGGLILCDDEEVAVRVHRGLFPGVQGGPLPEYIAAKAVCFAEALRPEFAAWAEAVLENARTLASALAERGYDVVTGGTDTPLVLVDLRAAGISGARAQASLEAAGLPCNRNLVPGDPQPLEVASGVRFGTSAVTTRGLRREEMLHVADLIADVLDSLASHRENAGTERRVRRAVTELARQIPLYPEA
jgi:glycine hydroxymethyltransferase